MDNNGTSMNFSERQISQQIILLYTYLSDRFKSRNNTSVDSPPRRQFNSSNDNKIEYNLVLKVFHLR